MKYAEVLADVPFMHTDHSYDYIIPSRFESDLQIGMRVKINFGGRKVLGFVIGIKDNTTHKAAGEILELLDVFAVIKPDVERFCSELARRYLTARSQVLNFATPAATKRVNRKLLAELPIALPALSAHSMRDQSEKSTSILLSPTLNVIEWTSGKVRELLEAGKRGIVLFPNYILLRAFESALQHAFTDIQIGVVAADMTPSQRYEQFMKIWRDEVHVVIGTRSAVFAPLSQLDFVVMVHENDDSFVEQQSGHWHTREAAILRSEQSSAVFIAVGYSRSVEVQHYIEQGKLQGRVIEGERPVKTVIVPKSDAENFQRLRLPTIAFNTIRQGLLLGPVLLQVPMRGYQLNIQCARCHERAGCDECGGGLENSIHDTVNCTRCGRNFGQFRCQWCSHTKVRSVSIGAVRTAEEIGKAFPGTTVYTSGRNNIMQEVTAAPCLVIATPGAEPKVVDGYFAAIVVLDPEITLNRIDLRAHEEAFRRWFNLKSLADSSGVQLICTQEKHPVIRYLMDDDPVGFAQLQLRERSAAQLPPTTDCYLVEGDFATLSSALEEISGVEGVHVLGPAQHKYGSYALVQTTLNNSELNLSLRAILARRSSSKAKGTLRVRFSPQVLP